MTLAPHLLSLWTITVCSVAALTDLRNATIPNWLTLPSLALALLAHLASGGPAALAMAALGAIACALAPLGLFTRGAIGGGDVKLFAALGAIAGARWGLEVQLSSYLLLLAFALAALSYRGQLLSTLARALRLLASFAPGRRPCAPDAGLMTEMRMGPAILLASLCSGLHPLLGAWP